MEIILSGLSTVNPEVGMSRGYSRTVFVVILSIFIPFFIISITVNQASAFPGKGSGGLGFDPAGDSEGAQCLNLFQIDLNELYNVSEPFVNRACHEVGSGGFYVANNHVIVNSEYPETLRQELEASGYHFLGNTPLEDLLYKLVAIRFVVVNQRSGKIHQYEFDPKEIVNTWDYINDDPLICSDFFPVTCEHPEAPFISFIPKLPPLAPGDYSIDMHYIFIDSYNSGFSLSGETDYNFEAGDHLVFANFLKVVKRAIQSR